MDAMILAAGLGTRLRPLTDRLPKVLVPVGGVPLLERVARRLVAAGVTRIVVNLHPFPEAVEDFVRERDGFGVEVVFSREAERPLETAGGLHAARRLFRGPGPITVHNGDVLTDLPLEDLLAAHGHAGPVATLAVMDRPSTRRLLFDDLGLLAREGTPPATWPRVPRGLPHPLAFCGVQVVSRDLPERLGPAPRSLVEAYLALAREGEPVRAWRADGCRWHDAGRPEGLAAAEASLAGALRVSGA
jgi:NDP-sugar pyrophosphorylase family protein